MNEPVTRPPTIPAHQFAANFTLSTVLLSVGCAKANFTPGSKVPVLDVEWLMALDLAPPSAKALMRLLMSAVEQYERQWGQIPEPAIPLMDQNDRPVGQDGVQIDNVTQFSASGVVPSPTDRPPSPWKFW